jgi:hypothetical protein
MAKYHPGAREIVLSASKDVALEVQREAALWLPKLGDASRLGLLVEWATAKTPEIGNLQAYNQYADRIEDVRDVILFSLKDENLCIDSGILKALETIPDWVFQFSQSTIPIPLPGTVMEIRVDFEQIRELAKRRKLLPA